MRTEPAWIPACAGMTEAEVRRVGAMERMRNGTHRLDAAGRDLVRSEMLGCAAMTVGNDAASGCSARGASFRAG